MLSVTMDAVQRLARPEALSSSRKPSQARGIGLAVAVLRRVAAGGVEQHRLVGEPPVAVARAADALHRRLARFAERKAQPGVDQRGGLARARRADEHVPGQLVEVRPLAAGALKRALRSTVDRFLEALGARAISCAERADDRLGRRRRRARSSSGSRAVRHARTTSQMTQAKIDDQDRRRPAREQRLERAPVDEGDQRRPRTRPAAQQQHPQAAEDQRLKRSSRIFFMGRRLPAT